MGVASEGQRNVFSSYHLGAPMVGVVGEEDRKRVRLQSPNRLLEVSPDGEWRSADILHTRYGDTIVAALEDSVLVEEQRPSDVADDLSQLVEVAVVVSRRRFGPYLQ